MKKASLILSSILFAFILYQSSLRFSLWNFNELNSDHAIHILMAESFDWSMDWYYWGQNRLGSFMPLLGSLFIGLGFSSFNALGLTQVILGLSLLLFIKTFIRSQWVFVAASALLLLPIFPFLVQLSLGHPYLGQLFFNLLILVVFQASSPSDRVKAILLPILAALSIWTSELSIAFILAFSLIEFRALLKLIKKEHIALVISSAFGFGFLYYAKKNAVEVESYAALFANHSDIIKAISQLLKDFYEIALFQSNKIFNSLLVWAYLIISLLVSFTLVRTKTKVPKLGQIFLLAAIFSFSLIIFSNWSAEMGNPLRYYTYSYILFALGLFLIIDKLSLHLPKVAFLAIILATFSLNASIQFNENYDPGAENRITRPEAELLIKTVKQELPDQESISVIGSYWNSYLIDGLSDNFIAFPREGEYIRDYRNLEKLQENRYFVLISNEWFDPFPEQLTEHQVVLKRLKVYAPIDEIQYALYLNTDWPADKL